MTATASRHHLTDQQQRLAAENRGLIAVALKRFPNATIPERDELISEGYVALARAAAAYDPSRGVKFSTLAVTVIYRAMAGLMRNTMSRVDAFARPGGLPRVTDIGERPGEEVAFIELRSATLKAMAAMPRDQRRATYARVIEGLTIEQIARRLGYGMIATNQLVRNGLATLRWRLGDQ